MHTLEAVPAVAGVEQGSPVAEGLAATEPEAVLVPRSAVTLSAT